MNTARHAEALQRDGFSRVSACTPKYAFKSHFENSLQGHCMKALTKGYQPLDHSSCRPHPWPARPGMLQLALTMKWIAATSGSSCAHSAAGAFPGEFKMPGIWSFCTTRSCRYIPKSTFAHGVMISIRCYLVSPRRQFVGAGSSHGLFPAAFEIFGPSVAWRIPSGHGRAESLGCLVTVTPAFRMY